MWDRETKPGLGVGTAQCWTELGLLLEAGAAVVCRAYWIVGQ